MNDDVDPLPGLAVWLQSDPASWPEADGRAVTDERMILLADAITGGPAAAASSRSRRRRRLVAVGAAPVVVVALAAAVWAVGRSDAGRASSFSCVGPGATVVLPNDGESPVDACRALWAEGAVVPGVTTAPSLIACVEESGNVAVIESDGVEPCSAVDGVPWSEQPAYEAIGAAVRATRVEMHDRYLATGDGCATVADWRRGLGDQPGARNWTVTVESHEPAGRCFDVGTIDPVDRRITLVAVAGDHSIGCDPRTGC